MRHRPRLDSNQHAIVDALRKMGFTVYSLAPLGKGVGDLLVGAAGSNYLFEVKDPAKPPSKRRLTDDEQRWQERWKGQVATILTVEDALAVIWRRELDEPEYPNHKKCVTTVSCWRVEDP